MVLNSRLHALCYGYALLLGLVNIIVGLVSGATGSRVTLGLLYVLVAVHQLRKRSTSTSTNFAIQRVG